MSVSLRNSDLCIDYFFLQVSRYFGLLLNNYTSPGLKDKIWLTLHTSLQVALVTSTTGHADL